MKIDKYEKFGKDKYRIFLDNGEVVETYDEVILKNDLLLKKEITSSEYQKIFTDTNLVQHYNACLKYISVRIRSTKEIYDYLKKKNAEVEDINTIIHRLTKEKFLDDDHFCECFIKDKLNFTTMGEYKIINELKKHNISNNIIDKYSYLWDDDIMLPKIEKLVDKQIKSSKKLDKYKLRNKIYYYLLNQGFSSDSIVKVLNDRF